MQVSKPYASFFSDENLEAMRRKKETKGGEMGPKEENNAESAAYGGSAVAGDAEPMPTDDHDDGYGDRDMEDEDGYGEE